MAGLGPDLQDCLGYLRATKKVEDPCNSSNISRMAANIKLHTCVSFDVSVAITLVGDNGSDTSSEFNLCVTYVTLPLFTGLERPEQLLLCSKPYNWANKASR